MNTHTTLEYLVTQVTCKPGWNFYIRNEEDKDTGQTFKVLIISIKCQDSFGDSLMRVAHCFPVPEATYNKASWLRWMFDCCLKVENHEMGEWFQINDRRPFAPLHGPGEDPYTVHEYRVAPDASILQDGSIADPPIKV